jgi:TetR/AcrR family tetracycline transcriptional repressor
VTEPIARTRWHRADVLGEAISLLDEVGLDRLTTRRLTDRLGLRAGALYRHFPSKRDLLTAIADQIIQESMTGCVLERDPSLQLIESGRRLRRAMLAHRDGARIVAGYATGAPTSVRIAEVGLQRMRDAGVPLSLAALAGHTIVTYATGFVLQEQIVPASAAEAPSVTTSDRHAAQAEPASPLFDEWTAQNVDDDTAFMIGLELIGEGFRKRLSHRRNDRTYREQPTNNIP